MATEIERKFLVDKKKWETIKKDKGQLYKQGYITTDPDKTIRVRITESKSFITIKGASVGASRKEYEYGIPREDAEQLLESLSVASIEKVRYKIHYKNKLWEVDEFAGENEGLIIAEIELKKESEIFEIPDWVSTEVTEDEKYYNLYLAQNPYNNWKEEEKYFEESIIPKKVLKDIAGRLEGGMTCFLHKKTLEIVGIPSEQGSPEMDWGDPDSEWAGEIKRVRSEPAFIELEGMDSHESYEVMEDFVFSLPEGRVRTQLESALDGRKPFANFNHLIHLAGKEREEWLKFRTEKMMVYVADQLKWKWSDSEKDEDGDH